MILPAARAADSGFSPIDATRSRLIAICDVGVIGAMSRTMLIGAMPSDPHGLSVYWIAEKTKAGRHAPGLAFASDAT